MSDELVEVSVLLNNDPSFEKKSTANCRSQLSSASGVACRFFLRATSDAKRAFSVLRHLRNRSSSSSEELELLEFPVGPGGVGADISQSDTERGGVAMTTQCSATR